MLNLFLLLCVLATAILPSHARADEVTPAACLPYRQEHESSSRDTRSRESIPYGEGLLWKIGAEDGATVHLFGTIHSQDRLVTSLPPPARLSMAQSRKLVMEVIPDQHANEVFNTAMYFQDTRNLEHLLDKDIYSELLSLVPDYGIPAADLPRLKPWAAFTLIGRPKPVRAVTQEQTLMSIAQASGTPVAALETMEELVSVLESLPLEDQLIILNDTVCNHGKIIRQTGDLIEMYLARDLAAMVIFNEQPHHDEAVFERFMQKILHERNARIIGKIEDYLAEGGAFISIGAMHLPDQRGLLKMLEERGYTISRVF